jgi:preprotein translocase subunit SecD
MAFFLDGEPIRGAGDFIIAPRVQQQITDRGTIQGLSREDAEDLSTLLRTGAFPVPLNVVQQEEVDATLGDNAVVDSVQAGLIAIAVVMAFMVAYYRLPGALASLALFVYVALTLAVYKIWPVTITSAGMAAFVLSVGMAVDANILIFERMKEEIRAGKTLVPAINAGFNRAWSSILDSNVSSLLVAAWLYWQGTTVVRGFALVLIIGVLVSMFSAVTLTRTMLTYVVRTDWGRRIELYHVER